MQRGCVVTNLKNAFDSLVCEFIVKAGKHGFVSRWRCNVFTYGNRTASSALCSNATSFLRSSYTWQTASLSFAALECDQLIPTGSGPSSGAQVQSLCSKFLPTERFRTILLTLQGLMFTLVISALAITPVGRPSVYLLLDKIRKGQN